MTWRAIIPNTQLVGKVFNSIGDGTDSGQWGGATLPTVTSTYVITGAIAVASGATNYIPPFPVVLLNGEVVYLVEVRAWLRAGSATISINQNGTAVGGMSAISVTTTPTTFTPTTAPLVASNDYFAPVVSSVASSPDGLTLAFVFSVAL